MGTKLSKKKPVIIGQLLPDELEELIEERLMFKGFRAGSYSYDIYSMVDLRTFIDKFAGEESAWTLMKLEREWHSKSAKNASSTFGYLSFRKESDSNDNTSANFYVDILKTVWIIDPLTKRMYSPTQTCPVVGVFI